ncbi:CLUMA_CG005974, isoform A [Clunio marinus]|uniref:phosphatidylinositol N-acetylglucosaminyltransferase n=1 Tax=Clunio marinus TaxID=568069 RepID=A0A1J1HXX0_9DIPT|nr:CLUMA_CG005974, isoform A [Clunio marinus]
MNICLASDFFFPNHGGVEEHIYNLSQCLLARGHKVIIITHSYGNRKGIRYMTNGLKVYYLPIRVFYNQCILPTMICNIPILRNIFIREQIQIVHGHSAFSALAHEAMQVGVLMGLRAIFTDHSLFGFADLSAVVTNKFLQICLAFTNHCICVSHTGKENTVLRARMPASSVSVIPNAVNASQFIPNPRNRASPDTNIITIVIVSRLVYRKGIDLLAGIIPYFKHQRNINFIIAGDGPKRELLEEIREKNNMQDRIQMLGALEHSDVRDVLTCGHIFLNTSLTEAYCMAIVEACSVGLHIVSTKVGGVPEVLPEYLNVILSSPDVRSLILALEETIAKIIRHRKGIIYDNEIVCPYEINQIVSKLYNWTDVAIRTEKVYKKVLDEPEKTLKDIMKTILSRSGFYLYLLVVSLCHLILKFMNWFQPSNQIDICHNYNQRSKEKQKTKL